MVDLLLGKEQWRAMTEREWETTPDPDALLDLLECVGNFSERKLRLYAAAVCRRIWHALIDECSREAVETAERYADGMASREQLRAAHDAVAPKPTEYLEPSAQTLDGYLHLTGRDAVAAATETLVFAGSNTAVDAARGAARFAADAASAVDVFATGENEVKGNSHTFHSERMVQSGILRDVVGTPFRPTPAIDPAWRTPDVLTLAQRVYHHRSFDRLPELAVALAEAGCDDAQLLGHLRAEGPHVRGCWTLDAVLGKA